MNNAPIVEALIDIQCVWGSELSSDQSIERLKNAVQAIQTEFPKVEPQISHQFTLSKDTIPIISPLVQNGFLLRPENMPYAVQFRRNGFTFSRLAPYTTWEDLRDNAKRLWKHYSENIGEVSVTRLATRYINRVQVPYPLVDGEEWLKGVRRPLTSPSEFSQIVSFMDQMVSIDAPSGATVGVLIIAQPTPAGAVEVDVLVDIDVFRQVTDLDPVSSKIWEVIEDFRNVKNRVFFNVVGSAIIEKYQ